MAKESSAATRTDADTVRLFISLSKCKVVWFTHNDRITKQDAQDALARLVKS